MNMTLVLFVSRDLCKDFGGVQTQSVRDSSAKWNRMQILILTKKVNSKNRYLHLNADTVCWNRQARANGFWDCVGGKKSIFPSNFLTLIPMVTYFHSQEKEKEKWLHHCQLVRSNLEIQVQPILLDDGVIRAISGLSQYVSSKPFRSVAGKVKRTCTVRSGPFSGHMCLLKSGLNPTLYQEYHMWFFFFGNNSPFPFHLRGSSRAM